MFLLDKLHIKNTPCGASSFKGRCRAYARRRDSIPLLIPPFKKGDSEMRKSPRKKALRAGKCPRGVLFMMLIVRFVSMFRCLYVIAVASVICHSRTVNHNIGAVNKAVARSVDTRRGRRIIVEVNFGIFV